MTYEMLGEVNLLLKVLLPSSYGLGMKVFFLKISRTRQSNKCKTLESVNSRQKVNIKSSESPHIVLRKLSESLQKVFRKSSESSQKAVRKSSEIF